MTAAGYLAAIERAHARGNATEHTYRSFLQSLLESRANIDATNEPKREKCGAPDYVVSRHKDRLTTGYVEAKDVHVDLTEVEKSYQLRRYREHLPNLLLTDYLEFRWFVQRDGVSKKEGTARLGSSDASGKITSYPDDQARALQLIDSFLKQKPIPITSAHDLAVRLAHFTHLIRDIIIEAFANRDASQQLRDWRAAFAATLLPELAIQLDKDEEAEAVAEFADMFAQTLAYGLFSARAASPGGIFNREQARKLIPRTNPFLRDFFEQITGTKLDDEPFAGFVGDIIQTLDHADIDDILRDFGKRGRRTDPVVHFYETFLHAYDPKLRELRGVYYTPEPVVNYIVESIDALLKDKFGLKQGLADRSTITTRRKQGEKEIREESHRVLILDPATGTATFLYRVLDFIREQFERKKNLGTWGDYVHEHLLPRLFGFELLMAPYAVAHFKLGLALAAWDKEPLFRPQWSYEPAKDERINIFLTNTLEDLEKTAEQLGPLRVLSNEANSAYEIKKHKPVLIVFGNPPYSGHPANTGEWITMLVRDYYVCDGQPLRERNAHWLLDDYVKFIRWAQWRIEQTGQGILGFITNHGYLDNPTFRGMRQNLMGAFDEIYLVDLHGNSKKKEVDPATGQPDKNVFDIQQGVAIGIFVKHPSKKTKKDKCVVRHAHVYSSKRDVKYKWLDAHTIDDTRWTKLEPESPNYLFIPQNKTLRAEYQGNWKITDAMPLNGWGIKTRKDYLLVDFDRDALVSRFEKIRQLDAAEAARKFGIKESPHWDFAKAKKKLSDRPTQHVHSILFRPFDIRYIYYEKCMIERGDDRLSLMRHMLQDNLSLITVRRSEVATLVNHFFCTTELSVLHSLSAKESNFVFPLYLYPNGKIPDDDLFVREEPEEEKRRPNFSAEFIKDLSERLKVKFVSDGLGKPSKREIGPESVFNYVYAVFHSPDYCARYAEFLRADFPRVPLTSDYRLFQELAAFGGQLVDLHARENGSGGGASFPIKGSNVIEQVRYEGPQTAGKDRHPGRVWINREQYFEGVAPTEWEFPIGGYLPAQRWLKDRTGRTISFTDMTTYPHIIFALAETARTMGEIDKAIQAHGGWPLK
jgi:hypothetical protein